MSDEVRRAREAFDRRDWLAAYEGLSAAGEGALRAADFADLATAAYLLCRTDDCITALQRAHQGYVAAGEPEPAVRTAFWLSVVLRQAGEAAVANGWISRAERIAADLPEDCVERGYIAYAQLMREVFAGKIALRTELPGVVIEYGRRFDDPNLVAAGLMSSGRRAIYAGRIEEGLAFLDEAIVCLLTGGLTPIIAGQVLCSCIEGCQELWEVSRVAEWTGALDAWCADQQGLEMFTGTCCLHKGQALAARGAFADAVPEFRAAIERFARGGAPPRAAGVAFAEMSDALRAAGDLSGADVALRKSVEAGWDPAPEQALLDLATGRTEAALATARRILGEARSPISRVRRLSRVVEVLLAAGDFHAAATAVGELSELVERWGTPMFRGHAARARGALALATGTPRDAEAELRSAVAAFGDAGSAYEVARTRLVLASALDATGDPDVAGRERAAAASALDTPTAADASGRLTERQIEVLRLVAAGRSNREIAAVLHLSEKTVARHLSNIFLKLDVPSRTAAAAYAYEHGIAG